MDHKLTPPVDMRIRIAVLVVMLLPIMFASRLSIFGRLMACLMAANTTQAVSIRPWFAAAGDNIGSMTFDKDTASVSLKQGDQTGNLVGVRPDFAGRGDKLPEIQEKKIDGVAKPVRDLAKARDEKAKETLEAHKLDKEK